MIHLSVSSNSWRWKRLRAADASCFRRSEGLTKYLRTGEEGGCRAMFEPPLHPCITTLVHHAFLIVH